MFVRLLDLFNQVVYVSVPEDRVAFREVPGQDGSGPRPLPPHPPKRRKEIILAHNHIVFPMDHCCRLQIDCLCRALCDTGAASLAFADIYLCFALFVDHRHRVGAYADACEAGRAQVSPSTWATTPPAATFSFERI